MAAEEGNAEKKKMVGTVLSMKHVWYARADSLLHSGGKGIYILYSSKSINKRPALILLR